MMKGMIVATQETKKKSFKDTLNLPHTDFPIRPQAKENDPIMIRRWQDEKLAQKAVDHNKGEKKFILHDGPPYANGHIHIGHAYNKIMKDIVCKSQRMFGKHVPVTPGWDCHGLPIELRVSQEQPDLSRQDLKRACRDYAQKWISIQREEFKQLGVLMDWDRPYLTMDYDYEASILRAFGKFVEEGYIERKNKTVPWCASCQTVLATAEIEYEDRKDPSIYVLFPLTQETVDKAFPQLSGKTVSLVVWTTTPWTLPLNRAVLAKPQADYVVLENNGLFIAVGKALADTLTAKMDIEKKVVLEFKANELVTPSARAHHPFVENLQVPVLLDDSVLLDEGSAFVHSAPGVGPQDYEVGIKNKLEIYSPIAPDGKYTDEIKPEELAGMPVADAQGWVIKKLAEKDMLLYKTSIRHSYPHCWRCHNGLIFRATKQWFCDLSQHNLKQKALDAIENITMIPEASRKRLEATVGGRLEWCLSRQRVWGVPIPAIICTSCDYTHITKDLVTLVAKEVANAGIEYWDTVSIKDILPKNFSCPNCDGKSFEKEQDILDVWFDSGVSHFAVLKKNPALDYPADMYLEGKDQHRGWFQSSLLTSMVLEKRPSMRAILTHGFTVDAKGRKMSKSLGNVVSPSEIIDRLGTDGLRLWVTSIDYADDAVVSDVLLRNVQEVFRKLRNTCRFLLSNLYDFDIEKDAVPVEKMRVIDQYALQELFEVHYEILDAYTKYDFTHIFHKFGNYCAVNLSSFYLDIAKDRLYVARADGLSRRSAQTACWYILDALTKLMAPILSFTAETVSDHYQKNKTDSIHLQKFADLANVWELLGYKYAAVRKLSQPHYPYTNIFSTLEAAEKISFIAKQEQRWQILKDIRVALLKAIEGQREKQVIKHSLEARVTVYFDAEAPFADALHVFFREFDEIGENVESFFKEFLIVSQFDVVTSTKDLEESTIKGLFVRVSHARGVKCPRCWQWDETDHPDDLCKRCQKALVAFI